MDNMATRKTRIDWNGKVVRFEPGKGVEKDVLCLVTSVGQRKNCEPAWGIKLQTTEPQRLYGERSPYMTRVLHTARIGRVNFFAFCVLRRSRDPLKRNKTGLTSGHIDQTSLGNKGFMAW